MIFDHIKVDYLKISEEALTSKTKDQEVINATVGVFLNDDKNLYAFNSVSDVVKGLNSDKVRSYMATDGGKEYVNNVINYVLGFNNEELKNNFHIEVNWSSGGSGAFYLAVKDFKGSLILLPNSRWSCYDNVCKVLDKEIIDYNLIKDNEFDINSIKEVLKERKEDVMILLNDPAHNPTGYTMAKADYQKLIMMLNENDDKKISILIDLAYIDFSSSDYRKEILPLFINLKQHVSIYLAFSGSKAFGVYGFRLGAILYLSKDLEKALEFKRNTYSLAQALYGPPTSMGIVFFNEIIKNKEIKIERMKALEILKDRSSALISELKKQGIESYPYHNGFFVTVKTKDSFLMADVLKKSKCYVVPTYNGLRIAVSSLTIDEIKRLVKIIKENIDGGK